MRGSTHCQCGRNTPRAKPCAPSPSPHDAGGPPSINHQLSVINQIALRVGKSATSATSLSISNLIGNKSATDGQHRQHSWLSIELHCALETRYNRYIVVHQQLNPLQIGYRPVTPVTSLSISHLTQQTCNKSATDPKRSHNPKRPLPQPLPRGFGISQNARKRALNFWHTRAAFALNTRSGCWKLSSVEARRTLAPSPSVREFTIRCVLFLRGLRRSRLHSRIFPGWQCALPNSWCIVPAKAFRLQSICLVLTPTPHHFDFWEGA